MADDDRALGPSFFESAIASNMVGMPMREQDSCWRQCMFGERVEDCLRIEPWVDDDAITAASKRQEIGVLVERHGYDRANRDR